MLFGGNFVTLVIFVVQTSLISTKEQRFKSQLQHLPGIQFVLANLELAAPVIVERQCGLERISLARCHANHAAFKSEIDGLPGARGRGFVHREVATAVGLIKPEPLGTLVRRA